jgi:hypothetical protein
MPLATVELFVLVLLRYADRVKIEDVVIGFREPQNRFVTAREFPGSMKSMLSGPDDAVAGD